MISDSVGAATTGNIKSAREKKLVAIGLAAKKAKLGKTMDTIKRVGASIISGVRYVLGAVSGQSALIDNNDVDAEKFASDEVMVNVSGFAAKSGKENPRRMTGN